ncbi:MAG: methyltransferase domain-containing protein [Lachnospiraceae bacterium]|nr:methyltransferase domain-containing protein [Lachnospiraceae bacterium]MBD5482504.1 methyltransferase domain-containing protein [Lachnospiraceae bacterium]
MKFDKTVKKMKYFGIRYYCNICDSWVNHMKPDGGKEEFFEQAKVIGGGYRDHVICPVCGNKDRTRFMDLCIQKYTPIYEQKLAILHFAPESGIRDKIKKNPRCKYISGDILKGRADRIVDIENICFKNASFDWIICNYVLQYVDDEQAIREMKRVLKPNGKMILSVPIGIGLDQTMIFPSGKHIGQSVYKRFYGRDVKERLEKLSGMKVKRISYKNSGRNKYGLLEGDTIFLLED